MPQQLWFMTSQIDLIQVNPCLTDIRRSMHDGPFDLILCRNLVFTYFDEAMQRRVADQLQ